jgi:hypothetical protein
MARFGEKSVARMLPQEQPQTPPQEQAKKLRVIEGGAGKKGRERPPAPSRAVARRKERQLEKAADVTEHVKTLPRDPEKRKIYTAEGEEIKQDSVKSARFKEERREDRATLERDREERMKRLEAIEHRITGHREAADRVRAEREQIEAEGREEVRSIHQEAAERVEASAAARDLMMEPMESVAREYGREQGFAARMKEEAVFEDQLETDEGGHISRMKNIPYLDAGAVHLALPAMWKRHDAERARINRMKPPGWERTLRRLDVDAERMTQMREKADELLDEGRRDAKVRNFFYRHESFATEDRDTTRLETFSVSPEGSMERREHDLTVELEEIEGAMAEAKNASNQIDDFLDGKQEELDRVQVVSALYEDVVTGLERKLKRLQGEHDLNHAMQQPERLDVYGDRLVATAERAKGMIESKKRELSVFRGNAAQRKEILVEIGEYEFEATEAKKKLAEWKEDPARARAMGYRLEALQDEAAELSTEIARVEEAMVPAKADKARYEGKTEEILRGIDEDALAEMINLTEYRTYELLREKARIEGDLADIRRAKVMREAPPRGDEEDVDLSDLEEEEAPEDDELDIDTSDFEKAA